MRAAVATPRSAWISASSNSSSVAASSLRLVKRLVTLSLRLDEVRRMPSVSRRHQPVVAGSAVAEVPVGSASRFSGAVPSMGCRSAPASSAGTVRSGGRSGEAAVSVGATGVISPAAAALAKSGRPSVQEADVPDFSSAGLAGGSSAFRPNKREKRVGLSELASAIRDPSTIYPAPNGPPRVREIGAQNLARDPYVNVDATKSGEASSFLRSGGGAGQGHVDLAAAAVPAHGLFEIGTGGELPRIEAGERAVQPPLPGQEAVGEADHARVRPGLRTDVH